MNVSNFYNFNFILTFILLNVLSLVKSDLITDCTSTENKFPCVSITKSTKSNVNVSPNSIQHRQIDGNKITYSLALNSKVTFNCNQGLTYTVTFTNGAGSLDLAPNSEDAQWYWYPRDVPGNNGLVSAAIAYFVGICQ